MSQFLLLLVIALAAGGIIFGVAALITGSDPGMVDVDPQVRAVPLPEDRKLEETDLAQLRFDSGMRGYRPDQVDAAIDRVSADVARKNELIDLLESEVSALRDGRIVEANQIRESRERLSIAALTSTDEELSDLDSTVDQ
ncbi:MAG: DivIVA domain-containing protein [Longispora sp.]|nr:DivIVA domain-containing protein [Longispora sp. (in: high G+C Gram-positive bacteria)]